MYTLNKTYIKKNFQWSETDVSSMTMKEIMKFQDARLNVVNTVTSKPRDILFSKVKSAINGATFNMTLSNWVASLDETIATVDPARGLSDAKVVEQIKLESVATSLNKGSINYPNKTFIPYGLDTDIVFTTGREEEDIFHEYRIADYTMAVVNGSFHPMRFIDKNVYILNGMDSARGSVKNPQVELIDFSPVGTVEQYILSTETEMKLLPRTVQDIASTIQRVSIKLTGGNHSNLISGKLPMLVINGNLRMFTPDIAIVSEDTIVYSLNLTTEVYLASKNLKNTKRYLEPATTDSDAIDTGTLDVLTYLNTELSFLVLLDAPDIAYYLDYLQPSDGPMQYVHSRVPTGMVFFDDGRFTHRTVQGYNEDDVSIITDDNIRGDSLYDRTLLRGISAYSDNHFGTGARRTIYHRAYCMELYSFT